MQDDSRQLAAGQTLDAEVCIVGAGAAGITIARELAGSSLRVVLLESGGLEGDGATQALYEGEAAGHPYHPLAACRLRYFGGSTNHWVGWCRPLDAIDFEARDGVPHSGWPIRREALDPFYERAQRICELGPFRYDPEWWSRQESGRLLPLAPSRVATKVFQFSPPTRFGTVYRDEVLRAANVHTLLHANAVEIELGPESRRVSRVRAATLAGNRFSVAARVVVLATGGIENARILLASRASRPNGIGNDRDLVGRFFMDHPHLRAGVYLPSSAAFDGAFYRRRDDQRAIGVLTVADALLRRDGLLGFSLTLSRRAVSRDAALDGDVQQAASDLEGGAALAAVTRPPDATVLECRTEPAPNPDSRVTLAGERDALGMPRARLDWQLTAADFASLRAGQEIVAREVGRAGVGRVQLPRDAPRSAWTQKVRGGQHHIGTTRMAEDPARGVVDAHCRVHGIENLYVAGSSVFPTAGTANPTLTLTALALRLADRIRARFA